MKDHFSNQAEDYKKYRPTYPENLIRSIIDLTKFRKAAWDCGTGNGQVASALIDYFDEVYATDISEQQLKQATNPERIKYSQQPAETTWFPDAFFDLIIVGQAVHWFDFDKFYQEVRRTLKPGGILALIGYHLFRIDGQLDRIIDRYYSHTLGPYWDFERKYIEDRYRNIPFPFAEIEIPESRFTTKWKFSELMGYLSTWSALQKFIQVHRSNPLEELGQSLHETWGSRLYRNVYFPVFSRIGRC